MEPFRKLVREEEWEGGEDPLNSENIKDHNGGEEKRRIFRGKGGKCRSTKKGNMQGFKKLSGSVLFKRRDRFW